MNDASHTLDSHARTVALAPAPQRAKAAASLQHAAGELGVYPASIAPVYRALADGTLPPMTVPAFNIRGMTYELARAIWRTSMALKAGPLLFELAPSESIVGDQLFEEYTALILAAAVREGYRGPVFLQGDHFSIDSMEAIAPTLELAKRVVRCGFYQIDIDASHLFDPGGANLAEFHQPNAQATAQVISQLRQFKPAGEFLTLGGEVGEIGGRNTTTSDLEAFYDAVISLLPPATRGLDKISAQTGTTHGGIVLTDGTTGQMPVNFDLAAALAGQARALGISGLVQHGASTMSLVDLAKLPASGVVEVHLATQIQNIVFDHESFPAALLEKMKAHQTVGGSAEGDQDENTERLSELQRFYKARWAAWGPFKRELLDLPTESLETICDSLGAWVADVFRALRIAGNAGVLERYNTKERV
ncbi:MAG: aldolase [Anaerolineae bacterium]|jgi:fructose/tagatose bisphosphate aldolase|nr:aldolase [Anaerolineae bacterium]